MGNRKLIALILWWCEGTKPRKDKRWKNVINYAIEITNTNPEIIKIFLDFLVKDLNVSLKKIKGQIQIHEGDDQSKYESYWSNYLEIPVSQFNKTIIRPKGNRPRNHFGTFKIRVYGRDLYLKLQDLLDKEVKGLSSPGISAAGSAHGLGP